MDLSHCCSYCWDRRRALCSPFGRSRCHPGACALLLRKLFRSLGTRQQWHFRDNHSRYRQRKSCSLKLTRIIKKKFHLTQKLWEDQSWLGRLLVGSPLSGHKQRHWEEQKFSFWFLESILLRWNSMDTDRKRGFYTIAARGISEGARGISISD